MDSTLATNIMTKLQQGKVIPPRSVDDIWIFAQDIQATVTMSDPSLFQDQTAYTIVAVQTMSAYVFGKFCAKQYMKITGVGYKQGSNIDGTAFIMQMRDH